jgi:hypothetical protein
MEIDAVSGAYEDIYVAYAVISTMAGPSDLVVMPYESFRGTDWNPVTNGGYGNWWIWQGVASDDPSTTIWLASC